MHTGSELHGYWRWLAPVLCCIFGTLIGIAGYYAAIAFNIRLWMRLGLCILFLIFLFVFKRKQPAWETDLAFLAISAGLLATGLLGDRLLKGLNIYGENARAYAFSKISETLPIIFIILLLSILSRNKISELYIKRGRLVSSMLMGLGVGLLLFVYFISQGGLEIFRNSDKTSLFSNMGWISVFSIFNGFMEELWFRGLFLSRFEWLLGRRQAFWITSILFGLLHAFGSFTGTLSSILLVCFTLLLGMAYGYIVQKTKCIWGAVLGHFFADFFLLLGYFG